jgi:ligand-binding sensor domain-containing protein/signal transduction histidine kinase
MNIKKILFRFAGFVLALCTSNSACAQKYYFKHYDIENGLSQSQVTSICQDARRQLWVSTLGGIDCFDSRQFSAFTIEDGLAENACFGLNIDNKGEIWCGSTKGTTGFAKNGLVNYPFTNRPKGFGIRKIITDHSNTKWVLAGRNIYKLQNGKLVKQIIADADEQVSTIQVNHFGEVYAAVFRRGIYRQKNDHWERYIVFPTANPNDDLASGLIFDIAFSKSDPGVTYFITAKKLFVYANSVLTVQPFTMSHTDFTCLTACSDSSLWIGTNNGVFQYKDHRALFINERNGFTGVKIFCIYQDVDDQLWFGTDGAGLYQYANDGLRIFDTSTGLNNDAVTSMEKMAKNEVYITTNGGGIFSCRNNVVRSINFPGKSFNGIRANFIKRDIKNNLWIGTDNSGLWKKSGDKVTCIYPQKGDSPFVSFITMIEDADHQLWFATNTGCFYLKGDRLIKVKGISEYCSSLVAIGKDSVLTGTFDGVKLISNKQASATYLPGFTKGLVLCLQFDKPYLFAGTNDKGIFIWNVESRQYQNITTKQGLYSNMVPSLQLVNGELWAGTGRGINRYFLKKENSNVNILLNTFASIQSECSQNAMLRVNDSLWVGTTHGINIYPFYHTPRAPSLNTVIENVQVNSPHRPESENYFSYGYKLPLDLFLPSAESYISLKFQAIQFNDKKIYYQHMLEGLDRDFSKPVLGNSVDYPSLPPGHYTFKVKALSAAGYESNVAFYPFVIKPALYQTVEFKIIVAALLLVILLSVYYYKTYLDRKKQNFISDLKLQEQENIRTQTAEDFHDDIGNKLTRINMLAELLNTMIPEELKDEKILIQKIRTSASEIYAGAKNILWALNPSNDLLGEVINEVAEFGEGLFEDTNTTFTISPYSEDINLKKLPFGYSHNMILIFKELLTNILKHAGATKVTFTVEFVTEDRLGFVIADNGKGYQVDQQFPGNGLHNIRKRSEKLHGEIMISSDPRSGTISGLILPIK